MFVQEDTMALNIAETFELLFDKNNNVAYKALQNLQKESQETDCVYPYMAILSAIVSSCVILLCLVAPVPHHNAQLLQVKSSKYRYQCRRRYQSVLKQTQTFPSQKKMLLIKYLQQ